MRCRTGTVNEMLPSKTGSEEFGDRPIGATQPSGSPMTSNWVVTVDPVFTMSTRTCAGVSGEANLVAIQQGRDHGEWLLACGECGLCVPRLSTMGTRGCKSPSAATSAVLMNCWCRCRCLLQPFPE